MSCARNSRDQRGTTTLEVALIASATFTLLLGILDIGRYFIVEQSLHALLTSTARAAVVGSLSSGGACPSGGLTLPATLTSAVPMLDATKLCVAVSTATVAGQTQTTVVAKYPFNFVLPTWSTLDGTLSDTTTLTY